MSSQLCEATARAAIGFAAGQCGASAAAALAFAVMRSMMFHKLNLICLTIVLLGALGSSAGYLAHALAGNEEPRSSFVRQTSVASVANDAKPAPGRMFVVGRVLDPGGRPVAGATVTTAVRIKFSETVAGSERPTLSEIGHVDADGSGRFRVDAPRTSSSRNDALLVIALAPGYGVGWLKVDADADEPAGEITLEPEQVIEGRLFDVQGRPVQGATVSVSSIERELVHDRGRPVC